MTQLPPDGELRWYGPNSGWGVDELRELWTFRELIGVLALRDLQVRYRQTLVGVAWAVIQPVTQMFVFSLLFGLLGKQPTVGDVPYPVAVLSGLIFWQLFQQIVGQCAGCLLANRNLVTKVYFPRLILPLATALVPLADFAVGFAVLVGMILFYGMGFSWTILLVPFVLLLAFAVALAIGLWAASLNALYRDIGYCIPFLLQVGAFASPVVYETQALVPERWRLFYSLNPLVGVLESFRWILYAKAAPPLVALGESLAVTSLLLLSGYWYFHRVDRFLADRI